MINAPVFDILFDVMALIALSIRARYRLVLRQQNLAAMCVTAMIAALLPGCDIALPPQKAAAPAKLATANTADVTLTSAVTDHADIFTPAGEARLRGITHEFSQNPGDQIVIVTVPSLGGEAIETYSLRNAQRWSVGDRVKNNGIIILVAPNDRKVRIEVGTGLETSLTNDFCAEVLKTHVLPLFKSGRYADGIAAGASAILAKRRRDTSVKTP